MVDFQQEVCPQSYTESRAQRPWQRTHWKEEITIHELFKHSDKELITDTKVAEVVGMHECCQNPMGSLPRWLTIIKLECIPDKLDLEIYHISEKEKFSFVYLNNHQSQTWVTS